MKELTAEFIGSQSDYLKCPAADNSEFAFVGRSNVGKSSLINMLTKRKALARISSTPGKTQLINHFLINSTWYLVDLPGYGWAKASKTHKRDWETMIRRYLLGRANLVCTFVLIDARHKLQKADRLFLQWIGSNQIPYALIFTKADKISRNALEANIRGFKIDFLQDWEMMPAFFVTSSVKVQGREEILNYIDSLSSQGD